MGEDKENEMRGRVRWQGNKVIFNAISLAVFAVNNCSRKLSHVFLGWRD
jgi:hypothetical protein